VLDGNTNDNLILEIVVNEILGALKSLVEVANSAADHANINMMDNAIANARAVISKIESTAPKTKTGGYPKDIDNPDDWAAFLARYLDNRVTNAVHNGIGLVALHIVDTIKEARANGK
jgi:hypothetical protein